MKLSVYTFVKNGLYQDYHVLDMLRHHLPLADEIVVHEGLSTDGTYEAIKDLDPKVKVFRSDWDAHKGMDYAVRFKDEARKRCTGDWCVLLDCDEFIPEWEFGPLRARLGACREEVLPVTLLNFYGNYKVYNADPERFRWPGRKVIIHRNRSDVEVYGDASSVRLVGHESAWGGPPALTVHHFGYVRKGARLREKWRNMRGRLYFARAPRFLLPSFLFNLFPHRWTDPDYLPYLRLYEGPHVKAVRDNPDEFVRDRFRLYDYLKKHPSAPGPAA
jgi:glycosyltransferase involved in cell wall biosynthesis